MFKTSFVSIILSLFIAINVFGQEKPPELNDIEKARIEIINLKSVLADAQYKIIQLTAELGEHQKIANKEYLEKEIQSLKQAIESTRPGFEFDLATGQFSPKKEPEPNDHQVRKQ